MNEQLIFKPNEASLSKLNVRRNNLYVIKVLGLRESLYKKRKISCKLKSGYRFVDMKF